MTIEALLPILIPGIIIQIFIMAYYIKHCWENEALSNKQKAIWIVLIAAFNLFAAALYLISTAEKEALNENQNAGQQERQPVKNESYNAGQQIRHSIFVMLIIAFEVFVLRMLFDLRDTAFYAHIVWLSGICFMLLLIIGFLSDKVKLRTVRYGLPFLMLVAAAWLVYLDQSGVSQIVLLALMAALVNHYDQFWGKIYALSYFSAYHFAMLAREWADRTGGLFFTDELISRLYADMIFFVIVFAAFYFMKRQFALNDQLRQLLATTRRQESELRELSVLAERQRIVGEIHDTVGHTLTTAVMAMEISSRELERDPAAAREKCDLALQQTRQGLADLRHAIKTMQAQDESNFNSRLNQLADRIMSTTDLTISIANELQTNPLSIQQNMLLKAVEEFATNSLKHGGSRQIDLLMQEYDNQYHLLLNDDGSGTENIQFGFGLQNIQNRAESLGGTMQAESSLGEGFALHIILPAGKPA